jgi:hypothetical protein
MNQKKQITLKVLEILELPSSEESLRKYKQAWWCNPRNKDEGGLRLTEEGWKAFETAKIKHHKIKLDNEVEKINRNIIDLDRYIDCPWYTYKKDIFIYNEKMAVQLVLFSGNLQKFIDAKSKRI